jgi:hypothetical protein
MVALSYFADFDLLLVPRDGPTYTPESNFLEVARVSVWPDRKRSDTIGNHYEQTYLHRTP